MKILVLIFQIFYLILKNAFNQEFEERFATILGAILEQFDGKINEKKFSFLKKTFYRNTKRNRGSLTANNRTYIDPLVEYSHLDFHSYSLLHAESLRSPELLFKIFNSNFASRNVVLNLCRANQDNFKLSLFHRVLISLNLSKLPPFMKNSEAFEESFGRGLRVRIYPEEIERAREILEKSR